MGKLFGYVQRYGVVLVSFVDAQVIASNKVLEAVSTGLKFLGVKADPGFVADFKAADSAIESLIARIELL